MTSFGDAPEGARRFLGELERGLREQHPVCRGATGNMLAVTAMAGAGHNRFGRNQILDRTAKATPRSSLMQLSAPTSLR